MHSTYGCQFKQLAFISISINAVDLSLSPDAKHSATDCYNYYSLLRYHNYCYCYCCFTASTDALAKELKDTYAESFDAFQLQQGTPRYQELETLVLPYLPYFSSCRGYDGHIPIYAALESKACHLPGEEDGVSDDWWRYAYPPFPHQV
jgi:hypothetical protein